LSSTSTAETCVELRICQQPDAAEVCSLGEDVIHVWQVSHKSMTPHLAQFRSLLSADETQRANRFRFDKNRNEFTIARGLLRAMLSKYLSCTPATIRFQFSSKGKPSLAQRDSAGLQFNVAHSGDLILLAFVQGRRLGVDVEQVRTDFATDEIAERFFSPAERKALRALQPAQRYEAFFRCWTRKEAYIKATGDGLSLSLDQFDVTLLPGEPARLLATRPEAAEAQRWTMYHLNVEPGFAAALVCERTR
jgi:4'-phosphopantetheinyl transferase